MGIGVQPFCCKRSRVARRIYFQHAVGSNFPIAYSFLPAPASTAVEQSIIIPGALFLAVDPVGKRVIYHHLDEAVGGIRVGHLRSVPLNFDAPPSILGDPESISLPSSFSVLPLSFWIDVVEERIYYWWGGHETSQFPFLATVEILSSRFDGSDVQSITSVQSAWGGTSHGSLGAIALHREQNILYYSYLNTDHNMLRWESFDLESSTTEVFHENVPLVTSDWYHFNLDEQAGYIVSVERTSNWRLMTFDVHSKEKQFVNLPGVEPGTMFDALQPRRVAIDRSRRMVYLYRFNRRTFRMGYDGGNLSSAIGGNMMNMQVLDPPGVF